MKKFIVVLTLLLSITLISCQKTSLNFDEFTNLVNDFTIEQNKGEVITDFSLPLYITNEKDKIDIKWEVIKGNNGAEIVNINEVKIYRPENTGNDIEVTLGATFKFDKFTETKEFTFTVLKHEKDDVALNDAYVLYINIDGFARYYYDLAVERGLVKNLEALRKEGIFFDDLRNEHPSITNPMQNMIVSGATSSKTQNVYRYYDKNNDIVVQQARENQADTIYQSGARNKITMASVRHFTGEDVLSPTNLNQLYVNTPFGEESNLVSRLNQAIKLIKGQEFQNGTLKQTVKDVPRFMSVYIDDLDGLGHNTDPVYGREKAKTEEQRINNVLSAIEQLDIYLPQLVDAYKSRGIYEKTAIFITTDHGMTPFGHSSTTGSFASKYAKTKWPALRDKLKSINSEYVFEYVKAGSTPKKNTSVVGISTGLQMMLTFKNHRLSNSDLEAIKKEIEKEDYVYEVLTRKDVSDRGIWRGANIDLIVVPKEQYHFHGVDNPNMSYSVRGQHDTTLDSANHIYGMILGGLVKQNTVYKERASVLSFGSTMAEVLGINLRDANRDPLNVLKGS